MQRLVPIASPSRCLLLCAIAGRSVRLDCVFLRPPFRHVGWNGGDGPFIRRAVQRPGDPGKVFAEDLYFPRGRVQRMRGRVAAPVGKCGKRSGLNALSETNTLFNSLFKGGKAQVSHPVGLVEIAHPFGFAFAFGEFILAPPASCEILADIPCAASCEASTEGAVACDDAVAFDVGIHHPDLLHAEKIGQHDVRISSRVGELDVDVQDEFAFRGIAEHAMRSVDVAMLVGEAVSSVADDRLDAVCEMRFGAGGFSVFRFRHDRGALSRGMLDRGMRARAIGRGKTLHSLLRAERWAVLDGVQEPVRRNPWRNRVLACGDAREETAAPGNVHAVVGSGEADLPQGDGEQHDHAAGHLSVAAPLRTPALHDEGRSRVRELPGQGFDRVFVDARDARRPCGRFPDPVVAGPIKVIDDGKALSSSMPRKRALGKADAVLGKKIPVQRIMGERELVQQRSGKRPVRSGVDGKPADDFRWGCGVCGVCAGCGLRLARDLRGVRRVRRGARAASIGCAARRPGARRHRSVASRVDHDDAAAAFPDARDHTIPGAMRGRACGARLRGR